MEEEAEVPSLITLCMKETNKELLHGDGDILSHIYELPSYLFDSLLEQVPPAALQKLQHALPLKSLSDDESSDDCFRHGRKRARYGNFNSAWRRLFKLRWPDRVKDIKPVDWLPKPVRKFDMANDWQQMYWETHIQECIDEAAEIALLPYFNRRIGDIIISDDIMQSIGYEGYKSNPTSGYSRLAYHCQQFGIYVGCLRLQNVLCCSETCNILRGSKLHSLVLWRIRFPEHVDGVVTLLNQNNETLTSLEFINCKLSSTFVNAICGSLHVRSMQAHNLQHFSIKSSSFLEPDTLSLPIGLASFLSSGRSLCSLTFCDNHLGGNVAKLVFDKLLLASSSLSIHDLSENNISVWLSHFNKNFINPSLSSTPDKSLQSLRVLNLRGNNLDKRDMDSLYSALHHIPNLETLDISDNPIEDNGMRSLIPYLVKASERYSPLAELKLENCELSCNGVIQLLEILSTLKKPLDYLSIADNDLGSQVAPALGKFLGTSTIKVLNIELIGLGFSGFLKLEETIGENLKLVRINISKNRGRIATAKFLLKLMLCAPELAAVNAAYNFIPVESWTVVCSALKLAKGKFEHLDLTGSTWSKELDRESMVAEFQRHGRPFVTLPSSNALHAPHDDDP